MRISSLDIFNIANQSMQKSNQDLIKTQQQLATGERVVTPSDDPVAAIQILALNGELSRIEQYNKNIDMAENSLQQQEGLLDGALDIMTRVRELAIQAGNTAVNTRSEYAAMATEIEARLHELVNITNAKNAAGEYIFAGFKTDTQPFSGDADSGFVYHGDDGMRQVKTGNNSAVPLSISGRDIFQDIPSVNNTANAYISPSNQSDLAVSVAQITNQVAYDNFYPEDMVIKFNSPSEYSPPRTNFSVYERSTGNLIVDKASYFPGEDIELNGVTIKISGTPTEGDVVQIDSSNRQDILQTLALLAKAMRNVEDTAEGKALLGDTVAATLGNLDNAQTNILKAFSSLGAWQNSLQTSRELHLDASLFAQEVLSDLKDLDYAEASTRLSMQTMILEAAQASFIRVSQLSLFNRL
jgi:flagellar hook-associated protein 3 FlgL